MPSTCRKIQRTSPFFRGASRSNPLKTLLPFLLAGALSGCAGVPAPRGKPMTAGEMIAGSYLNVRTPASDGWRLMQHSGTAMVFAKAGAEQGESLVATVSMFNLPPTETPEAFETLIKTGARKDTDPERFDVQEESFQYTEDRGYPCVHYRSWSLDKSPQGSSTPLHLALDGLYCRHPVRQETGFAAIYSFRGKTRLESLRTEAESFLRGVQAPGK